MPMKILVTGASGLTGSQLTKRLLREGNEVRVLVRKQSRLSVLEGLPVEVAHGDLAAAAELPADLMRGIGTVYNIAAAWQAENVPDSYFRAVNVEGVRRLLQMARQSGVRRFVHCSTVGVQGEIRNPPATEEHPYNPGDHYQRTKMDGELLALDFFRQHGLPGAVVRPVGVHGPGDTRFLKLFRSINRGHFRMIGSGRTLYHLTYIDDLVSGIVLAGTRPEAVGEVFTIGGESYLTLQELVEKIARILGRKLPALHIPVFPVWLAGALCELTCRPLGISPPLYRRRVDFFTKDRAFDIGKAKRLLGFRPQVGVDEGLQRTADWYRAQDLL
jgi:nucleoside-diphosphate-sugar epimerase